MGEAKKLTKARAREMLSEVQGLYDDAVTAVSQRAPYLIENMAFYRGLQWGTASPLGWIQDDYDLDEAREVRNHVRPTVRTAVADMLRSLPNPEVVPANSDQRSLARAEVSQKLVRSFLKNGVVDYETLYRAEIAAQVHGAAWFKVIWDPNKGDYDEFPIIDPETGMPDTDEFEMPRMEKRANGEISVQFVDIVSLLADPHAKDEESVQHVFHRKYLPLRILNDRFPLDNYGKSTEGRWSIGRDDQGMHATEIVENDGRSFDVPAASNTHTNAKDNQLAELVEYWEKPCNRYPGGRIIIFSGDVIVAIGPLPYEWPWVMRLGQNILPSGLYPDGVVKDIIPVQRSINLSASKRKEWIDKVLSPPLLVPYGSGINTDMFSDMAGELIEYNPGARPEWMRVPDIPGSMFNFEDFAVGTLQTISTYGEINRGEPPKGYDSGRALSYLYEFSKAIHEPEVHLFKSTITRVLQKCLRLARDFYQEGRIVKTLGENKRLLSSDFKRGDYDFDSVVTVEPFSGAPNSRALRYAEAMELFQMGAFDPDNPAAKALRQVLEVDYEDAPTRHRLESHYSRARNENRELLDDPFFAPELLDEDNHEVHSEIHTDFAVTPEFLALPEAAKERFRAHIEEHEMKLSDQTEAFAMEGQMLAGNAQSAEGGPPPPSAPQMASPFDGGGGAYGQNQETDDSLPAPAELTQYNM
tara:strand:- start:80 stop:2170 length:2091 start_codon:yes stop_codon:yes gene_type:complete